MYRIIEDGCDCMIKAKTMMEAISVCEESYLEEAMDSPHADESVERKYYQAEVLESCELLGELKN